MKILHLEYGQYPIDSIKALREIAEVIPCSCATQQELLSFLEINNYFDAIFTRLGLMIDENVLKLLPNLKYIVTSTTGLNHIDIETAAKMKIELISLKGESEFLSNIKSTAEHTWMLILALIRNLIPAQNSVISDGKWNRLPFLADEMDGKTIGIIGFGRLGKIVSKYANAFGMRVLVNNNSPIFTNGYSVEETTLEYLLSESDLVVLMISWSKENINFFNHSKFSKMKPNAYFINTSRGELVNECDLLTALKTKIIKGAAIDVLDGDSTWETEFSGNMDILNYAKSNKNLIITPHMGGYGKDSIEKTRRFVTDKFIKIISTI